jgi:phosphate transport system permease protein
MQQSLHQLVSRNVSRTMFVVCTLFTVTILGILALVTGYLISIGSKNLSVPLLTETFSGDYQKPGGLAHGLVGTGVLIFIASLAGIPFGMLCGIYLSEYDTGSWLVTPVRFVCDVLAGVPSIVVGILGYELLVRPIGNYNGWAGAMALAFIMVPIVARTTEEMLRLVPNSYREASTALGATKSHTIMKVVLPAATGSVITGIMLAIARVAGETAPLLFTALLGGYIPITFGGDFPWVHFAMDQPFPSLTVQIFKYANRPEESVRSLAWGGILVLIALIFVLNLAIRFSTRQRKA